MKKICLILLLCALLFSACGEKTAYTPDFTLAEGYLLENDRITATVIGEGDILVSDILFTKDTVTIFADSTGDRYVQGLQALLPIKSGENRLVIRFSNGKEEREYNLDITCITLSGFSVTVKDPDKTYHIGEAFDKSTISVIGVTEDGNALEITDYEPEYEFSSFGKATVGIEIDGYYESFSVMVTEEYRPVLDENGYADGVYYEIEGSEACLSDAKEREGFFAVPSFVVMNGTEFPVTAIAPLAFESASVTSVNIPESVQTIGDEAFSGCRALEWIEMPETAEYLGAYAFSDCEALIAAQIPDGIEILADGTFRGCKRLSRAVLPNTLKTVGERAFYGCEALETVSFASGLSEIEPSAFENCKALSTVIVENLTLLGDRAFAGCDALSVFASGDIETLGNEVFPKNEALTVYMRAGSVLLREADRAGVHSVFMKNGEYRVVSLPVEFPIETDYPYDETLVIYLEDGKMKKLSDYTVSYPKDACGYLLATIDAENFSHTFTVFIVYTEDIAFDTDTRGVRYELDSVTGKATLVYAPAWVKKSDIYHPEKEGLFLVPTTLWREDGMYVVTAVAEGAFDDAMNVTEIFMPKLTAN